MNTCLEVAVAVILDEQNRVLITQRPFHVPHGGCWEFPGGKIKPKETAEVALIREIKEEIGVEILQHQFLGEIHHQYSDKFVKLVVFKVIQFIGIPTCRENQLNIQWKSLLELNPGVFPEANKGIFELLGEP